MGLDPADGGETSRFVKVQAGPRPKNTSSGGDPVKSILLIDDDTQLLQVLERVLQLRGDGWDCVCAPNGAKAIAAAHERSFDLVVTDILMPECDGLETIGAIRRMSPTTKILAVTGGGAYVGTEFLRVAEVLGAHAVLTKPFGLNAFVESIRSLLADQGQGVASASSSIRARDPHDAATRRRTES
jgi:two-component system cell cycle response regulator CpdR